MKRQRRQENLTDLNKLRTELPVGTRVRVICDIERYPDFIAKVGMTGTVNVNNAGISEDSPVFSVKIDQPLENCEEWDNCIEWYHWDFDVYNVLDEIEKENP